MGGHAQVTNLFDAFVAGLNPCLGGRCGGTCVLRPQRHERGCVLILVLVEDVGGRPKRGRAGVASAFVLILVLVEDVGGHPMLNVLRKQQMECLNPCFGGRCGGTCDRKDTKEGAVYAS